MGSLERSIARAVLDLVTGKPFTYSNAASNSIGWVDFEHYATTWEQRVAGVAQACAAIHLGLGDPRRRSPCFAGASI